MSSKIVEHKHTKPKNVKPKPVAQLHKKSRTNINPESEFERSWFINHQPNVSTCQNWNWSKLNLQQKLELEKQSMMLSSELARSFNKSHLQKSITNNVKVKNSPRIKITKAYSDVVGTHVNLPIKSPPIQNHVSKSSSSNLQILKCFRYFWKWLWILENLEVSRNETFKTEPHDDSDEWNFQSMDLTEFKNDRRSIISFLLMKT